MASFLFGGLLRDLCTDPRWVHDVGWEVVHRKGRGHGIH